MTDIDALIKRAQQKVEYGPHYTCDCDNGRKGIVHPFCPKCGEPSEMVQGNVYIRLHVSATWSEVDVPIEDFRAWINGPQQ